MFTSLCISSACLEAKKAAKMDDLSAENEEIFECNVSLQGITEGILVLIILLVNPVGTLL